LMMAYHGLMIAHHRLIIVLIANVSRLRRVALFRVF